MRVRNRFDQILRWGSGALLFVTASLSVASALADKPQTTLEEPISTTVTALPIDFDRDDPARKIFGKLTFRGGLNLFAKSRHFGGFSGLAIDPSGTGMLAVSDAGTWMRAKLDYDGRVLKGLSGVVLGPLLGPNGKPLHDDADRDSESLALIDGDTRKGAAYVSFERKHRIVRYPFTTERFGPPSGILPLPAAAKALLENRGMEAIAVIRTGKLKGSVIAFSEGRIDKNGNVLGWLIGGPTPGGIFLKQIGGFDITDAAPLPDGGLVLLERRFRYSEGVKMRIRRIAAGEIRRGAVLKGEVLLEADDRLNIDNMEAIAAHRGASGEIVLTLMSDDNFSPFQRTLIMQFVLPEGSSTLAAPRG